MLIFITLLLKLLPLYFMVFLGFVAGKFLEVKKESIATILIYIVSPVIIFNGITSIELTRALIFLPVLFFAVCCLICLLFYYIGGFIWKGSEKNILAYACGAANTGYFGLPVVLVLFGDKFLGIAVLLILGMTLYDGSLGFFITARGEHTAKEALSKVLHLPVLYAFFAGLIVNLLSWPLNPIILDMIVNFRGVYTILGMMLVGLGLSQVVKTSLDYKFTALALSAKFIVWPIVAILLILADKSLFHFYNEPIYQVLLLMSIVPLAANTVAYAATLNTHPEKAAVAVLISTLVALIYIPLFVVFFFGLV